MTSEEQTELRKNLMALDGLLTSLMPEDASALALDPKRQQAAALMLGTVTLARDLLKQALTLTTNGYNNRAKATKHWGAIVPWLMKHLNDQPVAKAAIVAKAEKAGFGIAAVYSAMNRAETEGLLKSKKIAASHRMEVWKC